jgi:hypothetical protein
MAKLLEDDLCHSETRGKRFIGRETSTQRYRLAPRSIVDPRSSSRFVTQYCVVPHN